MKRLLLIDDDEALGQLLQLLLEGEGHTVTRCTDGAQGLAHLQRDTFDLVIMDLRMPVMDGVQMLDAARKESVIMPPVIVFSSSDTKLVSEAVKIAPAHRIISKPVEPQTLMDTVRELTAH